MSCFRRVYQQLLFNAIYALGITPLLAWLSNFSKKKQKFPLRQIAFADNRNGVGSLENLKKW